MTKTTTIKHTKVVTTPTSISTLSYTLVMRVMYSPENLQNLIQPTQTIAQEAQNDNRSKDHACV